MAGDINRVTLVGRLTRDPELRHLPSGSPVLEFGLAVNGRQQDSGGNWVDKPNFFDVKVYGNQAEFLSSTSRRDAASASTAGSTGARGRHRTAASARGRRRGADRPVPRQPRRQRRRREGGGGGYIPADAPATPTGDFPSSPTDDDIPF